MCKIVVGMLAGSDCTDRDPTISKLPMPLGFNSADLGPSPSPVFQKLPRHDDAAVLEEACDSKNPKGQLDVAQVFLKSGHLRLNAGQTRTRNVERSAVSTEAEYTSLCRIT